MSRPTIFIAVAQIALIVFCRIGLATVLKVHGYKPDGRGMDPTIRWSPLAVFLREHGLWLLLLPLLWVGYATWARCVDRGFILRYRTACAVGIALAALVLAVCLWAVAFPYTRPFFFLGS